MSRHSQVYNEFYELHHDSYETVMFFFERHNRSIDQLPLDEQLELLSEYLNACFETANYDKYLAHVDILLESMIEYNIQTIFGRDEFKLNLFRKSAALFNLERYQESVHINRQLCRMEPHNYNARILLRRNLYQTLSDTKQLVRHLSAAGLLFAAGLTAVELFFWRFLPTEFVGYLAILRNVLFVICIALLLWIELNVRWTVERVCRKL